MATGGSAQKTVLVTGAAGNIGRYFAANANKQKYNLRLMVCIYKNLIY